MRLKQLLLMSTLICLLYSCERFELSSFTPGVFTEDLFHGIYLVDDPYFPQDTLVLNKFELSDSSTQEKLMVQFRNDSLYLSNYNFNDWYGKWFCNFHKAKSIFEKGVLKLEAQIYNHEIHSQFEKKTILPWRKIEYQLVDFSGFSLLLIKSVDSSNFQGVPSYRESGAYIKSGLQIR